jgi:metallo-beta-lactamase class B
MSFTMRATSKLTLGAMVAWLAAAPLLAQGVKPMTAEQTLQRDIVTPPGPDKPFPPHKVVGNLYFVGTDVHSSFLFVTPEGNILINSSYEKTVPFVHDSVEKLGFNFTDIKILLGSHAHVDHQEGDAMVKQMTGATVEAMDRDIPVLQKMMPGGKPHPIDKVLHDGDTVSLGGTTLVAHLTPGHTPGCTTWTTKIADGDKTYNVVIMCGGGAERVKLVDNPAYPNIVEDYEKSYAFLRSVPCDIPLGSHTDHYNMEEKYETLSKNTKGPNPFIDPEGCKIETGNWEAVFKYNMDKQTKPATSGTVPSASN